MKHSARACKTCHGVGTNFVPCGTFPPLTGINEHCETCDGSGLNPYYPEARQPENAHLRRVYDMTQSMRRLSRDILDVLRREGAKP